MLFQLPACVTPFCEEEEGWCAGWREDEVEMNGHAFGLTDADGRAFMSRPIKIDRRRSKAHSSTKSSPTATFLSATSPFELPFIPPVMEQSRPTDHAVPRCTDGAEAVHELKWSEHQARREKVAKSMIASSFDQQTAQERLVNRRQLLRKEQVLTRSGASAAKAHLRRRDGEERTYSYIDITSW